MINTKWSPRLAYGVGLIASDGCLSKTTKLISFVSKDLELVLLFQRALDVDKNIRKGRNGSSKVKRYFVTGFKSR
ncbi:MAG: hypothetical protein U1C49_01660 [Candidatus Andersenbacteria bacterium]|nr:hypothetical protein [Candidatus Andersenbacteria bacterium]